MLALARLLLDALELVERALARLVEQPLLEIGRHVDGEDAELALVVELDRRVPVGARRLLVGGEQGVLERADEHAALRCPSRARCSRTASIISRLMSSPSSIRFPRTIASYGMSTCSSPGRRSRPRRSAATTSPRILLRPPTSCDVRSATLRPTAPAKCSGLRTGRSLPGEETSTLYSLQVRAQDARDLLAQGEVDAGRMVDEDAERLGPGKLEGKHLNAGDVALHLGRDFCEECSFLCVDVCHVLPRSKKTGAARPFPKNR